MAKNIKSLVEKAAEFRNLQAAAIENQVYEAIQPEVRAHILSSIEKHARNEQRLHELRADIEDDIENPIPEEDDFEDNDTLDVERGSEAEESLGEEGFESMPDGEDENIDAPPAGSELDDGVADVLKIEVDGVSFEAEYSPGDKKIVFINPEEGGEEEGGDFEFDDDMHSDDLESPEEEEEDFEFDVEPNESPEDEFEEEDEFKLRKEIHNRIAKKSKAGISKEDLLEEYRQLIRKKLIEELSTNIHDEKKKPVRKVTVEEKLESKQLLPKKHTKQGVLNENEQKELKNRLAHLLNL